MRPWFVCVRLVVIAWLAIPAALVSRDLGETLRFLTPSLMKLHHTPGLQLAVFRPGRQLVLAFGTVRADDAENQKAGIPAVDESTLFLGGELTMALIPLLLNEELERGPSSWREAFQGRREGGSEELALFGRFQEDVHRPGGLYYVTVPSRPGARFLRGEQIFAGYDMDRVFLLGLFHSVAGLPVSRSGSFTFGHSNRMERRIPRLESVPFSHIAFSAEGTAMLLDYLARVRDRSVEELLADALATSGMKHSRILAGSEASDQPTRDAGLLATGHRSADRAVPVALPAIGNPGLFGLVTNASDSVRLMARLAGLAAHSANNDERNGTGEHTFERGVFRGYFAYDPALGGYSGPFHVRRRCGQLLYELPGAAPGYASLAVFGADGRGLVILANGDDPLLLARLEERILPDLYPGCPPAASAVPAGWASGVEGTYRPEGMLPSGLNALAFLNDVQLRLSPDGRLQMSGFFERGPSVTLLPTEERAVFTAGGLSPMRGWRVRFFSDRENPTTDLSHDEITGFYSDGAVFRRVIWLDSLRGRIVVSAFLVFVLSLAVLRFYVRAKAQNRKS